MRDDLLPRCETRTRFAPSPTGYLHIGGARTALFSWAFAQKRGGDFALRIEDTDRARSTSEAKKAITDSLDWLGIGYTGPFFQSDRLERHRCLAWMLVEEDKAYRCYMTPHELNELREEMKRRKMKPRYDRRWRDSNVPPPPGVEPAIRLKMPLEGRSLIPDQIKGNISIDNKELDDPVILRADGTPTYNFACAVDDFDMNVTHVVRGEDHISNTPKQMRVIEALGGPIPAYAHMPLILARTQDEHGKPAFDEAGQPLYERMSKRNGAVDVLHYRSAGFLPEAVVNYLACLGWSPGEQEVFDAKEFVERFDLSEVNLPAARFDLDKLKWVNNQHMRSIGPAKLCRMTNPPMEEGVAALFYEHAQTLRELERLSVYFRESPGEGRTSTSELGGSEHMAGFAKQLEELGKWDAPAIKGLIKQVVQQRGIKFKDIGMPLRLALTGEKETPDISVVAELLGKKETMERLRRAGY